MLYWLILDDTVSPDNEGVAHPGIWDQSRSLRLNRLRSLSPDQIQSFVAAHGLGGAAAASGDWTQTCC